LRRYYEDLTIGERHAFPPLHVDADEALAFARQYDPQPQHADPVAAANGPFNGIIVSGWFTAALVMRLNATARLLGDTELLGLGVEKMAWPKPVRPGDELHVDVEVMAMKESRSNPAYGIVQLQWTARNQHGEVVFTALPSCWVPRCPTK
jgi:acyl dehydratase